MTSPIDLNPRSLQTVERILADYVPHCEVRAYGSRARWEAKDYSDLDLAVVGDGPTDTRILGDLREAFEESDLPIRVEVVDWHATDEAFRSRIESDCIVIQQAARTADWREFTIGDWSPFSYGKGLPKRIRNPTGTTRVYGSSGPVGYHDSSLTGGPTVIIGRKGTVGAVYYSPDPCWPIDTTFYVEGDDPTTQRFVYYALLAAGLSSMNSDSAVPGLSREAVHAKEILLPPLDDQHAISRILGSLDDKIELNRRMSETLDEMARALFRSWFVDIDPVRARSEGRPSGLLPDLDRLFPDSFEPSELGDIPDGWLSERLGTIVEQHRHRENPFDSPGTPFDHYSIPAYDASQTPKEELGENIKSAKFRVLPGTILLSRLNPEIERVWLSDVESGDQAVCSTEFMVLEPRQPIDRNYAYFLMRSPSFRRQIESLVTGTSKSHQRAIPEAVLSLPVLVPPAPIVHRFGVQVSPALARILHCRRAMKALAALRDTLLPRLLSGELRVRGAEQGPSPTLE